MRLPGFTRLGGYTLVELMVAMALGLLISAGVITIFIGTKGTQRTQEMLVEVQETARAAMDILSYDLRMAGSMGLTPAWSPQITTEGTITVTNNCFSTPFNWAAALSSKTASASNVPAVYSEDQIGGAGTPAIFSGCIKSTGKALPAQPGSDILSVHYLEPAPTLLAKDLKAGTVYARSRTSDVAVFQCAVAGEKCLEAPFGINANDPNDVAKATEGYTFHKVVARAYYIRPWSVTEGDGIPTLVRATLQGNRVIAEPLVEGVSNLQIGFGVDSDSSYDGIVDQLSAGAVKTSLSDPAWSRVKTVRVSFLVESLSEDKRAGAGTQTVDVAGNTVTVDKTRYGRVFSFSVAVRNPRA